MADRKIVRVINEAGQVMSVRDTHPILRNPDVRVLPEGVDPDDPEGPIPYEDWAAEDLQAYAEANGIDVGKATSVDTLAARIRGHEDANG